MDIKVILSSPDPDLPIKLGEKQAKIVKKDTTDFKLGNGTGPFRLESFEPGAKSMHVRNANYWREGANLEALEITAITNPIARVNALIAGDVQLINNVDSKGIRLIEQTPSVRLLSQQTGLYGGICRRNRLSFFRSLSAGDPGHLRCRNPASASSGSGSHHRVPPRRGRVSPLKQNFYRQSTIA